MGKFNSKILDSAAEAARKSIYTPGYKQAATLRAADLFQQERLNHIVKTGFKVGDLVSDGYAYGPVVRADANGYVHIANVAKRNPVSDIVRVAPQKLGFLRQFGKFLDKKTGQVASKFIPDVNSILQKITAKETKSAAEFAIWQANPPPRQPKVILPKSTEIPLYKKPMGVRLPPTAEGLAASKGILGLGRIGAMASPLLDLQMAAEGGAAVGGILNRTPLLTDPNMTYGQFYQDKAKDFFMKQNAKKQTYGIGNLKKR